MPRRHILICMLLVGLGLSACGVPASSSLRFDSSREPLSLSPRFATQVYTSDDSNTIDIYLTDIDALGLGYEEARMTGHLVHIHVFLMPLAGKTPIDETASNIAITHVVLANGSYGIYGGGGFMLPIGAAGDPQFGGTIAHGTLRPLGAVGSFNELLGWNEVSGKVGAVRDPQRAEQLAAWLAAAWSNPDAIIYRDQDSGAGQDDE
ncbi:MAG: hypothetical protein AAFX05_09880 [Planctomycetota bacterium]